MTIVHHAGICPTDMEVALQFYRDGIGLDVLVDTKLDGDMESLLGVTTTSLRTIFLGDAARPDAGIVELLDLGLPEIAGGDAQAGLPARGLFLLSFQVDVEAVLERLAAMGLGGTPRTMRVPGGRIAATVTDPDGVMVELVATGPVLGLG